MRISNVLSRILGLLWFTVAAAIGTILIILSFHADRELSEILFPIYLAVWVALFFVGRTVLVRCLKGVLEDTATTRGDQGNIPHQTISRIIWTKNPSNISRRTWASGETKRGDITSGSFTRISHVRPPRNQPDLEHFQIDAFKDESAPRFLFFESRAQKDVWTAFQVPSTEKVLQGIFTSTAIGDVFQQATNQRLLEEVLRLFSRASSSPAEVKSKL